MSVNFIKIPTKIWKSWHFYLLANYWLDQTFGTYHDAVLAKPLLL